MKTKFTLDKSNREFQYALSIINETNKNLFLTGKAGTGKTTLLKLVKEKSKKKMIIVAPTGVAAMNAGGVTINSFFQMPFTPFLPDDFRLQTDKFVKKSNIYQTFRYNQNTIKIIETLELLVIDEVSMVRCDVLDVIDAILRSFRNIDKPFGGVQILMIGDVYQLSPIVKDNDWEILKHHYKSKYFFSSSVLEKSEYEYVELTKIYRQKDSVFIDLLNAVRANSLTNNQLTALNSKYSTVINDDLRKYILLATHNKQVDEVNQRELDKIKSEVFCFYAEKKGKVEINNIIAPEQLLLKVGARVMFLKNDNTSNHFYNGKLGNVIELGEDKIIVKCDDGLEVEVEKMLWESQEYSFDTQKSKVNQNTICTFLQYPLKLAWAITIHKSQGLTFENVIADLGNSFATGQVYVALSRCTSFDGLILKSKICRSNISTSSAIVEFEKERKSLSNVKSY
jgi:ATP-dependent exoDNAse (exonuclease V) alpha subunit